MSEAEAIGEDVYIKASTGARIATSGEKTGRSPEDKRVVEESETKDDVWWGSVNIPLPESSFANLSPAQLYEDSIRLGDGEIASNRTLIGPRADHRATCFSVV